MPTRGPVKGGPFLAYGSGTPVTNVTPPAPLTVTPTRHTTCSRPLNPWLLRSQRAALTPTTHNQGRTGTAMDRPLRTPTAQSEYVDVDQDTAGITPPSGAADPAVPRSVVDPFCARSATRAVAGCATTRTPPALLAPDGGRSPGRADSARSAMRSSGVHRLSTLRPTLVGGATR